MVTVQKSAVATHQSALTAAAAITDEKQRMAAVEKARADMRTAIEAAITANPNLKYAMMPSVMVVVIRVLVTAAWLCPGNQARHDRS